MYISVNAADSYFHRQKIFTSRISDGHFFLLENIKTENFTMFCYENCYI